MASNLNKQDFINMVNGMLPAAIENLRRDGALCPVAIIVDGAGRVCPLPIGALNNDDEKERKMMELKMLCEKVDALFIALIFEGFYKNLEKGELKNGEPIKRASEYKDAKEAIVISYEHHEGKGLIVTPFTKKGGEYIFDESVRTEGGISGAMSDLLPKSN